MRAEDERKAYELAQKAVSLKGNATPRERAYIDALTHRYSNEEKPDRAKLNRAFAEAMAEVHKRFPDDTDAATIYAEALMNLRPWNYWTPDGQPYAETAIFVPLLESVMRRDPHNPGANHLYIHAAEATKPQLAEGAADRLRDLVPAAGHLQHMPGHIYVRIGRYADASLANEKAIAADEDYITQCRAQGLYPLEYYPHNIHFLWLSSTWEGRSKVALEAARKVSENGAQHVHELSPAGQIFPVISLYANARFGKWEEILKEKQPPTDRKYWLGMWHYARGLAFARTKRFREADGESKKLSALAADRSLEEVVIGGNSMGRLLRMASLVLAGEMEAERGKFKEAVAQLQDAILLEDSLNYIEPPDWHYPIRQSLGAVLLKAGRPLEAETVYWEDLRRNPDNGWSLFGLMQSLRAQGKEEQAAGVEARFKKAWANADITLTASRF
jgi:tetratricopeptide (TPR) repeat protein